MSCTMDNKSDVKAIMARFQANGTMSEESSPKAAGRPKQPVQPTLSGQALQTKKVLSESLSSSAGTVPPKPSSFLKNTPSSKSDTAVEEINKTKALANKFANAQDDTNKPFVKHQLPSKSSFSHLSEPKPPLNKPSFGATASDPKPVLPKPAVIGMKPNRFKEDSGGGAPSVTGSATPPKMFPVQLKPSSSFIKLQQKIEVPAGVNTDTANKPSLPVNSTVKPPSNFRTAQGLFNKDPAEQPDRVVKAGGVNKLPVTGPTTIPPPKPLATKKPSLKKPSPHIIGDDPAGPKKNPLPNSLALGPAPAKPNRPPNVNLEAIKRGAETPNEGPVNPKKPIFPPPPSHPSNHSNPVTPTPPLAPSLPPRHPGAINQTEDVYDDVDGPSSAPPPLPPSSVHPSQRAKEEEDEAEDDEMYEDLEERWESNEQKPEKKKEKDNKEEKKRLESEKKEQKEREKKENDARKKFKLAGPIEIIHQGKACVDCKGNKTDLSLKQGDCVDIIRVQGNPEGKWLGRTQDGSIGYVKTTSVEIDFNSLKNHQAQQAYEPEVYDDIDVVTPPDKSKKKGPGVVLPPLPGDPGEIYDDIADPNLEARVPPPSQFSGDQGGAVDEEIYDDVDNPNMPPPPPISSIPTQKPKEMDPKKQKKLEKEFRKQFKYEGEIRVLHQVSIVPTLTNKKWGNKELAIKAGEKLDVIVKAVDNKLICRNDDGKFGYVSTSYIVTDDGEIYDDIGDDSIYDND